MNIFNPFEMSLKMKTSVKLDPSCPYKKHEWREILWTIKYLCAFFLCLALIVSHMQFSNKPRSCHDIASTQCP